jgi:CHASE3 domain sensor protein
MTRAMGRLVDFVARIPARVQVKLLAAFLAIEILLMVMGAVGLQVLSGVNARTDELIKLQRKIEAYRQVQHDTTNQLYGVSSALLSSDDQTLSSTLRQLNQFGYDVDRLQFVAKDEAELLARFREDYDHFIDIVTRVVELIRSDRATEARAMQVAEASRIRTRRRKARIHRWRMSELPIRNLRQLPPERSHCNNGLGAICDLQCLENSSDVVLDRRLGHIEYP